MSRKPAAPAAPEVTAEVVTITPELAETWLGRNSHNRPLRNREVIALASAITRGEWVLNGDAIRFDVDEVLLDGQHRLWAIVEADQAVQSMVVSNLPPLAQHTMDQGARRSLADALRLNGEKLVSHLSTSINTHWRWLNANPRGTARPSVTQGLAWLEAHPELRDATADVARLRTRFRVSGGVLAAWLHEARLVDPEAAEVFLDKLLTGVGLEEGSPILLLREHLERMTVGGIAARGSGVITHALLIKAWNAYLQGRVLGRLVWRASGSGAEAFPEMEASS